MQFHMNFMISLFKNVCEKPYWDINSCYFGSTIAVGIFAMSKILGHLVHNLKWFSIFWGP